MVRQTITTAAAVFLLAGTAAAQSSQRFSVQLSGLGASLSGDEFEGWGTGTGFEAQVRYNHSALSIGGGYQLTKHGLEGIDEKLSLGGVFIEPRYVIATNSNSVAPYVSLRLSMLKESGSVVDDVGDELSLSASGLTFNGGGGVLFRLSRTINLDLGATWGYTDFGEVTAKFNGTKVPLPDGFDAGSGTNVIFRAGIAIGLGR